MLVLHKFRGFKAAVLAQEQNSRIVRLFMTAAAAVAAAIVVFVVDAVVMQMTAAIAVAANSSKDCDGSDNIQDAITTTIAVVKAI
jgi:hypothetical protein